eukprot:2453674-Rhodomonas_salina.2
MPGRMITPSWSLLLSPNKQAGPIALPCHSIRIVVIALLPLSSSAIILLAPIARNRREKASRCRTSRARSWSRSNSYALKNWRKRVQGNLVARPNCDV